MAELGKCSWMVSCRVVNAILYVLSVLGSFMWLPGPPCQIYCLSWIFWDFPHWVIRYHMVRHNSSSNPIPPCGFTIRRSTLVPIALQRQRCVYLSRQQLDDTFSVKRPTRKADHKYIPADHIPIPYAFYVYRLLVLHL